MATGKLTVKISMAWWVVPYIRAHAIIARAFNLEPNMDRVVAAAMKGVRVSNPRVG